MCPHTLLADTSRHLATLLQILVAVPLCCSLPEWAPEGDTGGCWGVTNCNAIALRGFKGLTNLAADIVTERWFARSDTILGVRGNIFIGHGEAIADDDAIADVRLCRYEIW